MRLTLVDRIVELEPGRQIKAIKSLTLAEEYLGDHFPHFPIMPGVMMLEAMYQAAAWLVRATEDFANSMVTISEANNVKYSDFVEPGETLVVSAVLMKHEKGWSRLKCQGEVDGKIAVRARLVLESYCLSERGAAHPTTDAFVTGRLRETFRILYPAGISDNK